MCLLCFFVTTIILNCSQWDKERFDYLILYFKIFHHPYIFPQVTKIFPKGLNFHSWKQIMLKHHTVSCTYCHIYLIFNILVADQLDIAIFIIVHLYLKDTSSFCTTCWWFKCDWPLWPPATIPEKKPHTTYYIIMNQKQQNDLSNCKK